MLFHFLYPLRDVFFGFNVLRYITFRGAMAILTSVVIAWVLAPRLIAWLKSVQFRQAIRDDGPATHKVKQGTPTMGGLLIVGSFLVSVILWGRFDNRFVWYVLLTTVGFGAIGFADDWMKVRSKSSKGVAGRTRLILEMVLAGFVAALAVLDPDFGTQLSIPFFKNATFDLGWWYVPFAAVFVAGFGNAVNLTDGLDGLAAGVTLIVVVALVVFAYVGGHVQIAAYLRIPFSPSVGELAVLGAALLGGCIGFLWYNAHPAELFMGDVGSLSLGGFVGMMAILAKQELVLVIVGGLFVAEALSVMLQVGYFKMTGKRIFRMAPLHHHFELSGWAETKVVIRFWIVSTMLVIVGLATLKIR